jgi:hypothetical protein
MMQDRERSRAQGLHDQREAKCQVIAGPTVEPHLGAVLPGDHAKAVVLDLVQPQPAGGRRWGLRGQAWRDEAERERHKAGE